MNPGTLVQRLRDRAADEAKNPHGGSTSVLLSEAAGAIERLVAMLGLVEYAGHISSQPGNDSVACPICEAGGGAGHPSEHVAGCALDVLLRDFTD